MALVAVVGGAIVSGIFSWLGNRSQKSKEEKAAKERLGAVRLQGQEDRTTLNYQAQLAEWKGRSDRFKKRQGAANYAKYAQQNVPSYGPGMNRLTSHQSAPMQAPGAMPTAPGIAGGAAQAAASMRTGSVQDPLNVPQQVRY